MSKSKLQSVPCAIYTRKSIEDKEAEAEQGKADKKHFGSLEAQHGYCEAAIKLRAGELWEVYPVTYEDNGYSGATMNRPAFQRLLADARAGRFRVIVVYKIDRVSRSLKDFVNLVAELEKHGVAIVSVTQNFDTSNALGRFIMNMLMSFAELERGMIGDRVRDKVSALARKGRRTCGIPTLGYDLFKA